MAWIILPVSDSVARALADSHNLSVDYLTRGEFGTKTLIGSKRNVSELRTLAIMEGAEFETNL